MKTVSTKLDKQDFEKFQDMCNDEGQCMSESIRELIKLGIDAYKEGLEIENQSKPMSKSEIQINRIEDKTSMIPHGKIFDNNGNLIGTF